MCAELISLDMVWMTALCAVKLSNSLGSNVCQYRAAFQYSTPCVSSTWPIEELFETSRGQFKKSSITGVAVS